MQYGVSGRLLPDEKYYYRYDSEGNLIHKSPRNILKKGKEYGSVLLEGSLIIPSTGKVLAENVTPLQAFDKLIECHVEIMSKLLLSDKTLSGSFHP